MSDVVKLAFMFQKQSMWVKNSFIFMPLSWWGKREHFTLKKLDFNSGVFLKLCYLHVNKLDHYMCLIVNRFVIMIRILY